MKAAAKTVTPIAWAKSVAERVKRLDWERVHLRHGVSRIRSGHRHTVGIIFHDAQ